MAYRPDGRQLCTSSRDGKLSFWNTQHATLEKVINGRKDAVGGRKVGDRRTAESSAAGKCFTRQVVTKERRCGLCLGVRSRRQLTFFLLLCVCVRGCVVMRVASPMLLVLGFVLCTQCVLHS